MTVSEEEQIPKVRSLSPSSLRARGSVGLIRLNGEETEGAGEMHQLI